MFSESEVRAYIDDPGTFLCQWRKKTGVPQKGIAMRVGISIGHVSAVERHLDNFAFPLWRAVLRCMESYPPELFRSKTE